MAEKITSGKASEEGAPENARRVLSTLIIVAAVANLPMAMANVALPSIGKHPKKSAQHLLHPTLFC